MKNIIKNNLKQRVWLTGCVTLLFILLRPMLQLMTYENEKKYALTLEGLIGNMEEFFLPNGVTDMLPTAYACIVIAFVFFGYIFSKKQVDLYHSIPVDRKHLFAANYLSGITVYAIAFILQFILSIVVAVPNHYMTGTALKNLCITLCVDFVHFVYGYTVVICAMMLAGNILVALAATAVLGLLIPGVAAIIEYFEGYFYITYDAYSIVSPTLQDRYYWLSPFTSFAEIITRLRNSWSDMYYADVTKAYSMLILPVAVTVLLIAFAYFLYKNRPSEAAGKAIAFTKSRMYIEIPIVIIGGMLGCIFMSAFINTYKSSWIWIGLVLGVLLSHCVLEVIINESFKAVLSHKLQLLASLAITVLITFIFYGDLTGYDRYIPKREDVVSAGVYFEDIDNNLSNLEVTESTVDGEYYNVAYKNGAAKALLNRFTSDVLIDKIFAISQIGVTCVDDMIDSRYDNPDGEYYYRDSAMYDGKVTVGGNEAEYDDNLSDDEAYEQAVEWMENNGITLLDQEVIRKINIRICYELKNGKKVIRWYTVPLSKVLSAMNEVYKTEEFKKVHFDLYEGIENNVIDRVEVYDGFDEKVVSVTDEDKDLLLQTYMSELKLLDIDTISTIPIGRITPLVKATDLYDETYAGYFIYPTMVKTLKLIENYGVDMSKFTNDISADELLSLYVSSYNMYGYNVNDTLYLDNLSYDIDNDAEFLNEIAPLIVNSNNMWSNSLLIGEKMGSNATGVDMTANLVPVRGIQRIFSVTFKDGRIPEKIQKDIVIRLWEENR